MNSRNAWDVFFQTGQVADYLRYAAESRRSSFSPQRQGEPTDADYDPRTYHPGEKL